MMSSSSEERLYLEEDVDEEYRIIHDEKPAKEIIVNYIKEATTFTRDKWLSFVYLTVPVLHWLPRYPAKSQLLKDVTAGCTLGVVNLPQGMAYALLASVPAVYGLYTSFFPVLIFFIFSTSKHVSIGTFAIISMMVGDVVDQKVPPCPDSTTTLYMTTTPAQGQENITYIEIMSTCEQQYEGRKVEIAIAISVAVGLIQVVMRILHLGFVRVYLSDYLIAAYTCGASYHVLTSQVPKLLGISVPRLSGPFSIVYTYIDIFKKIGDSNPWDILVSVCCIIFLVIGKEINIRYKKKLPFPVPWELAVIIFSTLASYYGLLAENHSVVIVGEIPTGIQVFVPKGDDIINVLSGSIAIAIVSFAVEISLAQMFASQHSYDVDANQEVFAMGISNILSSFFGCFPCASSLSRTAIWDEVGGKSQLVGVFSSIIILTVLLWIGPLFETLPQAALGAIIVVNLKRLLLQLNQIAPLWRKNKLDSVCWMITWLGVILFGVAMGLGIALGVEIFLVIVKTQLPKGIRLGHISKARTYKPVDDYKVDAETNNSILLFTFNGPLYFANKYKFLNYFCDTLGYDPVKRSMTKVHSNDVVQESNMKELEENGVGNFGYIDDEMSNISSVDSQVENKKVEISMKTDDVIKTIVFDMSSCSFLDNDAAKLISQLHKCFLTIDIKFIITQCKNVSRKAILDHCGEDIRPLFFVKIENAMLYAEGRINVSLSDDESETFNSSETPTNEVLGAPRDSGGTSF